jgi:hypothetical protein
MPRKRKPRISKIHHVTGTLNMVELSQAGSALTLEVYGGDGKLGTIVIGRGSFSWFGKKRQHEKEWSWTSFAKLMDREAYGE